MDSSEEQRTKSLAAFWRSHKKTLVIGICALTFMIFAIISAILYSYFAIEPYTKFVVSPQAARHTKVGIVLGAGVAQNGKPYKELQARLDTAADALESGTVDKLILSGDNRFKNYDEPTAMFNYLVKNRKVSAKQLQRDFAGRSTYESCERAAVIFQIKQTIIFSANSHLPRAIYLCRHFGIEAYGISSGVEANNSTRRELLARVKAIYNAKLIGEPTVLGDRIAL